MRKIRTELDDEFEDVLKRFGDELSDINQKSMGMGIEDDQDDIKSSSCYLIEIIDTILGNRR